MRAGARCCAHLESPPLSSLPFLLSWEDQRRLRERNETPARRARVEGEREGNQHKLEKSGGFTPLVVIPRVKEDPSSLTACLSPSPSLRAEPTAWVQSVPASDVKETRKPGTALLSLSLSHALSLFPSCWNFSSMIYFFKPLFFPSPSKQPPSGQKRKSSWVLCQTQEHLPCPHKLLGDASTQTRSCRARVCPLVKPDRKGRGGGGRQRGQELLQILSPCYRSVTQS